jgi:hypothetical protein
MKKRRHTEVRTIEIVADLTSTSKPPRATISSER